MANITDIKGAIKSDLSELQNAIQLAEEQAQKLGEGCDQSARAILLTALDRIRFFAGELVTNIE